MSVFASRSVYKGPLVSFQTMLSSLQENNFVICYWYAPTNPLQLFSKCSMLMLIIKSDLVTNASKPIIFAACCLVFPHEENSYFQTMALREEVSTWKLETRRFDESLFCWPHTHTQWHTHTHTHTHTHVCTHTSWDIAAQGLASFFWRWKCITWSETIIIINHNAAVLQLLAHNIPSWFSDAHLHVTTGVISWTVVEGSFQERFEKQCRRAPLKTWSHFTERTLVRDWCNDV